MAGIALMLSTICMNVTCNANVTGVNFYEIPAAQTTALVVPTTPPPGSLKGIYGGSVTHLLFIHDA